jgi:hypothetical protein
MTQRHAPLTCTPLNVLSIVQAGEQPSLTIGLYNYANIPEPEMNSAAREAERLLVRSGGGFLWTDCLSQSHPCVDGATRPNFLVLRLLARADPTWSDEVLGITSKSGDDSFAAVFCDRAIALRTYELPLTRILGSAMAHEIVHMLLPVGSHSQFGLMRSKWFTDDLKVGSRGVRGLTRQACVEIYREAVRRSAALATN